MKKKIAIALGIVIVISIISALFIYSLSEYEMNDLYSFSEISITGFELEEKSRDNVTELLQKYAVETESQTGFVSEADKDKVRLYLFHSLADIANTISSDKLRVEFKKNQLILENMSISSMGILDLIYYVNICEYLDIEYSVKKIMDKLAEFYDDRDDLFFMDDETESFHAKIIISAMCLDAVPEIKNDDRFKIENGLLRKYEAYEFLTQPSKTLYNSGGDILYALSVLGIAGEDITEKQTGWFEYWKDIYEDADTSTLGGALAYSEYLNIARIFEPDVSTDKIQSYYNNLDEDVLNEDIDYYMLSNSIKMAEKKDNQIFKEAVEKEICSILSDNQIFEADMDLVSTVYGVMLSKCSNFEYDKDKLQNYINENYKSLEDINFPSDALNTLYYTLILDQQNNDYNMNIGADLVQRQVDRAIRSLEFKDNINGDILTARRAVEIVMDLKIHDMDVSLNKAQVIKLKRGMSKVLKIEEITGSVLLTDLYIADQVLKTGLVTNGDLIAAYEKTGEKNIYNAFRFMVCFDRAGTVSHLEEQKGFILSLQVKDGIYGSSLESDFMGISINMLESFGGIPNDKT